MILFIVALFMIGMLVIGWWSGTRYVQGVTDFLLAGRRLGVGMTAATLAATHFGGGMVMGGSEYGFNYGWSGIWYGLATGIGILLLSLTTAERFRDLSLYTVPDYLEQRYGGKTIRVLGALLSLIALVGILAAVVVLSEGGGFGNLSATLLAQGVDSGYFSFWGLGTSTIMWILLPTVMYTLIGQDFYQRLFAAKNGRAARTGSIIGGVVLVVISFFPVIIGMGARALSDLPSASNAFPWVVQNLLNPVVGGIVLAAILAAIMSTADSLLTAATSHIVKDFWIETFQMDELKDEQRLLNISRLFTVIIGALGLLIALIMPGIIDALIYSYTMYSAGVFIPVIGGVLWRSATREGALASLVVGSVVALWGIVTGADVFGVPAEIYAALVSLAVFVVVSLLTRSKEAEMTLQA